MKNKKIELDVDIIGGLGPLTTEEEQALSEFFRSKKQRQNKAHIADNGLAKAGKSA